MIIIVIYTLEFLIPEAIRAFLYFQIISVNFTQ